jgi:hypothetical protein
MEQMVLFLFCLPHLQPLLQAILLLLVVVVVVKMQLPQILVAHQVVVRAVQILQHHQEFLDKEILEVRVVVVALNLVVAVVVLEQKE